MNIQQGLRFPGIHLIIVTLILLTVGGLAILIAAAWLLFHVPPIQSPPQADPLEIVNTFHDAINSNDADAMLALFTRDATIDDSGSIIQGRDEIRNWMLHSQQMAGLHLTMLGSEIDADQVTWIDVARNGAEEQRGYLLRWRAVIRAGKIQSLTVALLPMPDGK